MIAKRRAQFRVPNVPRSQISERAEFEIYEHTQCQVFERTSLQHAYVIPCHKWGHLLCYRHAEARWCLQRARGACGWRIALDGGVTSILALWGWEQTSKCISSISFSFVRIEWNFFYNTQEAQTQKNDGPEF